MKIFYKNIFFYLILMGIFNHLNAQNKTIVLWNNHEDSVIINKSKVIAIGINGKTCNDCLKELIKSIEHFNKDIIIYITVQSSQDIIKKKSMRNGFELLFENNHYHFFIKNNISDSLLNENTHTPTVFLFNEQSFSSYNIEDYHDYKQSKTKGSFLKEIGY